jgi:ammonia channel protein AmtB
MNLLLAAGAGAFMAGLYALLSAGRLDFVMVARGLAAGVVAVCAGAPFIATWSALLVGGIAGMLVPLSTYFVLEKMRLDDAGGIVAMHGVGSITGLLTPAFFATGLYGAGWNGVGHADHLGVAGQGVTGLLAAAGRQPDWPGQLTAQAAAVGASIIFSGLLAFVLFQAIHRLIRAWQPVTVESRELEVLQEQSAPADEETARPQVDPSDEVEDDPEPEGAAEDHSEGDEVPPNSDTGEPDESVVAEESATMPDEETGEVPDNSGEPAQS